MFSATSGSNDDTMLCIPCPRRALTLSSSAVLVLFTKVLRLHHHLSNGSEWMVICALKYEKKSAAVCLPVNLEYGIFWIIYTSHFDHFSVELFIEVPPMYTHLKTKKKLFFSWKPFIGGTG